MNSIISLARASLIVALAASPSSAGHAESQPKPATEATKAANRELQTTAQFQRPGRFRRRDTRPDRETDTLTIEGEKGNVVWDLEAYRAFIGMDKPAPDTVNPSLWRNAQLNMQYGLFKVHDQIYQVRGYDLSNITFMEGDTGWIVFDPLISVETAKAAYDLVTQNIGQDAGRGRHLQPLARRSLRRRARHRRRGRRKAGRCESSRPSNSPSTPSART